MKNSKFQPEQLRAARRLRSVSLRQLSERLEKSDVTLSKQALSKYENGTTKPSGAIIEAIAVSLNLPTDYFFMTDLITLDRIEFRKLEKYSIKEAERVYEEVKLKLSQYLGLESILNISSEFVYPNINNKVNSLDEIDVYTDKLRIEW